MTTSRKTATEPTVDVEPTSGIEPAGPIVDASAAEPTVAELVDAELQTARLALLKAFNAAAVATYAAKTGKSEEMLAAALLGTNGDGTRYTAAEALAMGFVDEVLPIGKKASKTAAKNDRSGELAARARLLRAKSS